MFWATHLFLLLLYIPSLYNYGDVNGDILCITYFAPPHIVRTAHKKDFCCHSRENVIVISCFTQFLLWSFILFSCTALCCTVLQSSVCSLQLTNCFTLLHFQLSIKMSCSLQFVVHSLSSTVLLTTVNRQFDRRLLGAWEIEQGTEM